MTQIFTNNIYGPATIVGTANQSCFTVNVAKGDFSSLKQTLKSSGISEADISELKNALDAETAPSGPNLGPKVATWIGEMVKKAADGTWKVATDVAGSTLMQAIRTYYGL